MHVLISRPVALAGHRFAAGLAIEVDAALAQTLIDLGAAVCLDTAALAPKVAGADAEPNTQARRKGKSL